MKSCLKLTRLMLTRGCAFDDPVEGPVRLALLILYACAYWYIGHGQQRPPVDPRAYRCDAQESLPCAGMSK